MLQAIKDYASFFFFVFADPEFLSGKDTDLKE